MGDSDTKKLLTEVLVDYAHDFGPSLLGESTRSWAKWHILDLFGTMLAASSPRYSASSILEKFIVHEGGSGVASLVGRPVRTAPTLAALYNGTMGYYCDNEPHHPETVMHAPAAVMAAALATAEAEGVSGEELLTAAVLGIDVACRMSDALNPRALYARGFHPTAVAGVFGATAASGYLLKLNRRQWRNAIGLGGQQACGLLAWASDHTEHSRPFNPGLAARNGVTAARLASLDFGGPPYILDGKYDFFTAFSGECRPERLTDGLRSRFYVNELAIKLYACCGFIHAGLDALLDLMNEESLRIEDIANIQLHYAESGAAIIDNNELRSHNAQYILAVGALRGGVAIDDILVDRLEHREAARLARNVELVYDEQLDKTYPRQYSSIVVLHTHRGASLERLVDWPKGYPQNPLSDQEILSKFTRTATLGCSPEQARHIADLTLKMDILEDSRELGAALSLRA